MAELRRPAVRLAAGLAVGLVALVELQSLVQTLSSQTRVRERVVRTVREAATGARPRLAAALRGGDARSWQAAAQEALHSGLATEIELFDPSGERLFAYPAVAPVRHWPPEPDIQGLRSGRVLTLGPVPGDAVRILSYAGFDSGERPVILRLSTPAHELVDDLRERRQMLAAHALTLVLLLVAVALVLAPGPDRGPEPRSGVAFEAYEAAMARLRQRGDLIHREHEAQLRRLEDHLQDREAMARAGELTAGIVHEVRNGLGTILGYARMVERSGSPEEALAARRIREECETLESVVRRFMDFVRRESLAPAAFDLARMLSRVAAREGQRRPEVAMSLHLPEADPFVADEELLERAFENLVRNACEAAGPGGRVDLSLVRDGAARVVEVTDDGPGLPADVRPRLRPFFSTKAGGLGLGLPIALKIVQLHGGTLELGDAAPRGLSVRIRLPAAKPASPGTAPAGRAVTEGNANAAGRV